MTLQYIRDSTIASSSNGKGNTLPGGLSAKIELEKIQVPAGYGKDL